LLTFKKKKPRECREEIIEHYSIITIHNHILNVPYKIKEIRFFFLTFEDYFEYLPNNNSKIYNIIKRIDDREEVNEFYLSVDIDPIHKIKNYKRYISRERDETSYTYYSDYSDDYTDCSEIEYDDDEDDELQWEDERKKFIEKEMEFDYYNRDIIDKWIDED
jgi:hypothetical protein